MRIASRVRRLARRGDRNPLTADSRLLPFKTRALDVAIEAVGARSFADLGAVWAVEAGYTFYGLRNPHITRACIVDETITPSVRERAAGDHRVKLVEGTFGDPVVLRDIGFVDVLLAYDILLHQVRPDWDDFLRTYAPLTRCFAIANPQWTAQPEGVVRLIDLGRDRYLANVPPMALHDHLFDRLDEINEERHRPWRDVHDVWQWGITDAALRDVMTKLDFHLVHEGTGPRWRELPNFTDRVAVFSRNRG
jgi:hypothetical protein